MAVRSFAATSKLTLSGTFGTLHNGASTMLCVAKPASLGDVRAFLSTYSSGTFTMGVYDHGAGRLGYASATNYDNYFGSDLAAGEWQVVAITKAAGAVAPRAHVATLGTWDWQHGACGTGTQADIASSITDVILGNNSASTDQYLGLMAVAAVFNTALSDANVESLQTTTSTQQLNTLGAVEIWDLNQASTGTTVTGLKGVADQSALTGTTVVTGDDPPGWTFGLGSVWPPADNPPAPPLRVTRSSLRLA